MSLNPQRESRVDFISVAFGVRPSKLQRQAGSQAGRQAGSGGLRETAIAIVQAVVKRGVVGGEIGAGGCCCAMVGETGPVISAHGSTSA